MLAASVFPTAVVGTVLGVRAGAGGGGGSGPVGEDSGGSTGVGAAPWTERENCWLSSYVDFTFKLKADCSAHDN